MQPFIGQMTMFGGNFAPRGWALCEGQLLAISQNQALFSILGTIYGGDGRTTFGLPELRGRLPMHAGNGPGLTPRPLGQRTGQENVTLISAQMPSHNHNLAAEMAFADKNNPTGKLLGYHEGFVNDDDGAAERQLGSASIGNTGGSISHSNLMPFQCVHFIIALVGIFPSRS